MGQQRQHQQNMTATLQLLRNEGHVIGSYKCIGSCHQQLNSDGVCLTNCKHCICKKDFKLLIDNVIGSKALLKCPECIEEINPIDIQRHGTYYQYSVITQLQLDMVQKSFGTNAKCVSCGNYNDLMDGLIQYVCMYCGIDNCLQCKGSHSSNQSCDQFKNENNHSFRKQWKTNVYAADDGAVLIDVIKNSNEWNGIVKHMKYPPEKVLKISRVQHKSLWAKYSSYSSSLGGALKEVKVWHGTRKTNPSLIYSNGFLKEKSRVGGCLWYAVNSSYSMNGFQHPIGNGQSQLFLCLVAGGKDNDVKYIRNNKILNVYKNEATYPAYLITYK